MDRLRVHDEIKLTQLSNVEPDASTFTYVHDEIKLTQLSNSSSYFLTDLNVHDEIKLTQLSNLKSRDSLRKFDQNSAKTSETN